MSYCVEKDVRAVLTDLDRQALGGIMVEVFITKAENIVNGKLSKRFTVPFAVTPPMVKTLTIDIAAFYVLRTLYTQEAQNTSNWALEIYKEAMTLLDEIASGQKELLDVDGVIIPEFLGDAKIYSQSKNFIPTFDIDDPLEWRISPGRLKSIAERRAADV